MMPKIIKYAAKMPNELCFVDEKGKPIEDLCPFPLSMKEKLAIATVCVTQKQSIDTAVSRILRQSLKRKA